MAAESSPKEGPSKDPMRSGHRTCPVCAQGSLTPTRTDWRFLCDACGYLCADLAPRIGEEATHHIVDEGVRANAMDGLRHRNFEKELDRLAPLHPLPGGRLLEVGCANGWFLALAAKRGW